MSVFLAVFVALFGSVPQQASAQPVLNFKRIVNNWPTIELYFSIACDGAPAYFTDKRYFKVYENGVEIGEFDLWCPDPLVRCAISVALVFDCSGSMAGSGIAGSKAAGNAFVDLMDGVNDEAAIIWFNSAVVVQQGMTVYQDLLHAAVNSMTANGATAVWDGIYSGLLELINNGVNPCRAVIVMTDGGDNSSSHQPADCISLANRNRIRVFCIGLGTGIQSDILKQIADLTGGKYYETPNPAQLTAIYQEISTIIFQGFQECIITYQAKCMDGGFRKVDLSVINFCNGQDTKTKQYKAPKDTSTYRPLHIQLAKRLVRGNSDVKIPLQLMDPIDNELLYPATFTVLFDESCVQFKSIATPSGSLYEGIPITITPMAGGVTFTTMDKKLANVVDVPMTMAELTFKASDPDTKDTVCCPLKLLSWVFEAGCFRPVLKDGEICIIPRQPVVACDMQGPAQLLWVRSLKDYNPNPFTVSIALNNTGDREARNVRFKIEYDKKDLSLVAPVNNVQNGTPRNVDPAGISEGRWDVMAKRRLTGDSVKICIVASFDNHDSVRCCLNVWVPPADAVLGCTVTAPTIVADRVNLRYTPMPFDVTVTVTNEGGKKSDSVFARITVPADLRLFGADAPDRNNKRILPSILNPGQSGGTQWTLWHPITLVDKEYIVGVWVRTSNADSSYCEVKVLIPALEAPVLSPTCHVPDSLHFNEALDSYVPNPFDVTLSCVNKGGLPASNVTGFIYIPANAVLNDPAEPLRKAFPSPMSQWTSGDPVPQVKWTIKYTRKLRFDTYLDFKFVVGGLGPTNLPTDSVETTCRVRVPGLAPSFACDFLLPDSLQLNASQTDVTPNPFTIRYRIWNTSRQSATITLVDLNYAVGDGMTLDPSTPKTRNMNRTLLASGSGDTLTVTWVMNVQNRITRRLENMFAIAYDDEGNPVMCPGTLPIANLKTSLICDVKTSEAVIKYFPVIQEYDPTLWVITATLTNTGGAPIHDVVAELELEDSSLVALQAFDPGFGTNKNPDSMLVLFPQSTKTFQWGFRLASPNMSGTSQFLYYNIKYKSKETPAIPNGCDVPVEIEPVVMPVLSCQLMAPDTIWFNVNKYIPSPFDLRVRISNTGNGDAQNVKAFVLQDTRFNILPPASREYGELLAGKSIDFADTLVNAPFQLNVNPRAVDGYDTVRVIVMADGIPSAQCQYPIYVMHEQRPVFQMSCQANPNSLTFDEQLNDYVPNPFDVVTTAINIGETKAENCQLVFVGPPRFTPADNTPIVNVGAGGRMNVGDTVSYTWKLVPLRRTVGGWDTLVYQIQGRGGMGNRIIIGECRVPMYVPAARVAEYDIVCSAPAALTYDKVTGVYNPDPFQFKATVTNNGKAEGQDLEVTAVLPQGLILNTGDTATKKIGNLAVGNSVVVMWLVRPITNTDGVNKTPKLCARVADRYGKENSCCTDVLVPPATNAALSCAPASQFDTLKVDYQRGTYETNPFTVSVRITNNGARPAYNVRVNVVSQMQDVLQVLGVSDRLVALRLDSGITTPKIEWQIKAIPREDSGFVDIRFDVTSDDLPSTSCSTPVYVHAVGHPALSCDTRSSLTQQGDSLVLLFDYGVGAYKDDLGQLNRFTVTSYIHNVGTAEATRVRATILPPEGVTLDEGETAFKEAGDILVNGNVPVSWNLRPVRQKLDAQRLFSVELTSDNALQQKCDLTATIKGAPKSVTVRMPTDPVGRFGDKIAVPVFVDTTIGKDIFVYKLNIEFDPEAVRFVDAVSTNTLTALGWSGPRTQLYTTANSAATNVVRVEDYTTGSPLNVRNGGVLVVLVFEAVYNGDAKSPEKSWKTFASQLDWLPELDVTTNGVTKKLYSSMNSPVDDDPGRDVSLKFESGMVTVAGDCLVPLVGGSHYSLAQNKPNPFNPSTVIEYEIGEETAVRLVVFDDLGREVAVLVNARQTAGKYAANFDASTLASGTYVYRLETSKFTRTLRMVLAR